MTREDKYTRDVKGSVIRICDVVDSCEDCPRYGEDCDGDKR